jgi:lysophospholipase L1-like esterase
MRNFIKCFSVVITLLLLLLGSLRLHPYYHFAPKQSVMGKMMSMPPNDTLKIAFIGDSWAAYHCDYDKNLELRLTQNNRPAQVVSQGNVGAKSKEIYQRMFSSTKQILLEHPNYCVVSAGINDAVAKMGSDYYVHHYMLIIRQLLDMGIVPVVLEMPEVNYRAIASREAWTMRLRHVLSSLLTDSELYGFESYKNALVFAIRKANIQNRIVYISSDLWNSNGFRDERSLYLSDETHLNDRGYEVLDSCITIEILKDIRK